VRTITAYQAANKLIRLTFIITPITSVNTPTQNSLITFTNQLKVFDNNGLSQITLNQKIVAIITEPDSKQAGWVVQFLRVFYQEKILNLPTVMKRRRNIKR
jgi:hypothetical protein